MSIILEINNPNLFEKQLFDFVKQQKDELEEVTVEALKSFINSFQNKDILKFKKRDIYKNLSTISSNDDEPRDESIELYSHVEDSATYVHDLRRVRNK